MIAARIISSYVTDTPAGALSLGERSMGIVSLLFIDGLVATSICRLMVGSAPVVSNCLGVGGSGLEVMRERVVEDVEFESEAWFETKVERVEDELWPYEVEERGCVVCVFVVVVEDRESVELEAAWEW